LNAPPQSTVYGAREHLEFLGYTFGVQLPLAHPQQTCTWTHHGFKHAPAKGATREDTLEGNPALYLSSLTAANQREIETATAAGADVSDGAAPGKVRYLRDVGVVIGWDEGEDATLSFVECTNRHFHGRPMHDGNRTARAMRPR
jgi:hypothetical protein